MLVQITAQSSAGKIKGFKNHLWKHHCGPAFSQQPFSPPGLFLFLPMRGSATADPTDSTCACCRVSGNATGRRGDPRQHQPCCPALSRPPDGAQAPQPQGLGCPQGEGLLSVQQSSWDRNLLVFDLLEL